MKYSVNMLLTCTLYYDARPGYLIRPIRTVCNYRKCSFLTGLITSLTDLLQAYHQGRFGTSKTKSTGSPVPTSITVLSEFFCFTLARIFFCPRREPVRRLGFRTFRCYLLVASQSLTPLSCAYNFFRLISALENMF